VRRRRAHSARGRLRDAVAALLHHDDGGRVAKAVCVDWTVQREKSNSAGEMISRYQVTLNPYLTTIFARETRVWQRASLR